MAYLLYNISQVLGITIIHSLWQGLIVYFVLRVVFTAIPTLSSVKKYTLSAIALLGMAVWFIYTFCAEATVYDWSPVTTTYSLTNLSLHLSAHRDFKATLYATVKDYLPYVSVIYAIGLLVNVGRLGMAWSKIRVIKKGMISADNLQERINYFSRKLNIRRHVKVAFSRLVDVPCVIGYFKPILLLPITLTFQLSAEEIETIILHELSHIKGNDYLVNLVQQIISVLLFFNPFAQLINNIISTERENRCDDMVVEKTGTPLTYAYALLKLEEVRQGEIKLALAATQNKHHLLTRIERIMKTNTPIGNIRPILLAVVLIAGSLSVAWLNPEVKNGKITFKKIENHTAVRTVTTAPEVEPVKHQPKKVVNISYDTTKSAQLNDTTKKKKIKLVVEDENGNKKEYNSVNDMPESVREDFYKENSKFGNNVYMNYKFADSNRMKAIQNQALAMTQKFNSPEWKKQMEAMQLNGKKMAEDMQKRFNSPEFKKQMEKMQVDAKKMSEDMQKRMNDPEFKKQMEKMQFDAKKMSEDMQKRMNDPEWKKQMEDMKADGEKMKEFYNSPEWKKQMEEMKVDGEKMKEFYNSPEWKAQIEDMKAAGEKMKEYYNSPEWKKQVEEMKAAGAFYDYNNADGTYNKTTTTKKATDKKTAKPAVKSKVAEKPEKKEKVEKPEKKEAPEKLEKKEVPEQQEM